MMLIQVGMRSYRVSVFFGSSYTHGVTSFRAKRFNKKWTDTVLHLMNNLWFYGMAQWRFVVQTTKELWIWVTSTNNRLRRFGLVRNGGDSGTLCGKMYWNLKRVVSARELRLLNSSRSKLRSKAYLSVFQRICWLWGFIVLTILVLLVRLDTGPHQRL